MAKQQRQRSTDQLEIFDAQPSQKGKFHQVCNGDSMSSPLTPEGVSATASQIQSVTMNDPSATASQPPVEASGTPQFLSIDDRAKLWGVSKKAYQGVVQQTLSQRIRSQTGDGQGLVSKLMDIVENGEDRDAIKAAELLLDRGWGRSVTPVVQLNDAAISVASRYGIDPGELASVAASLWQAQSGGTSQGEIIEILPERTDTEEDVTE